MVSIIVPIYNMGDSIIRCVESIEMQTYKNIEVILVDDGSTDDSLLKCKELSNKYNNITFITKKNGGVSTARNIGIEKAIGKWIMFVDPDDYLSNNIVEKLYLQCNNSIDISICCCTAVESEKKTECHFFESNRIFETFEEKKDLYKQLMKMSHCQPKGKIFTAVGVPWGKLYRLDMIKRNHIIFDPKLKRVQDNVFNIEAFSSANMVSYIDEPLYMYSFSHMSTYFDEFRPDYSEIFTLVRIVKYNVMKKYKLLEDEELLSFYINESIMGEANIMKYGIFHKKNPLSYKRKIKKAIELSKLKCFNFFMDYSYLHYIDSIRYKFFWIFLKFRFFSLIYFLSII